MSTREAMARLIQQTDRAIRQQMDTGVEAFYLPDGLDAVMPLPSVPMPASVASRPANSLATLYAQNSDCVKCRLGNRRQHFVFGSGNEHASVLFVGEAPGAEEDEQGVPFVGAAGQLLTKILKAIEFSREEVYIANIVKCRPPNNRDPEADEIATCTPILKEQIRLIQPRLICALGRIAAQTLLGTQASLNHLRGRFHDYNGIKVLVTYHPSALLRNPAFKRPTWEDVQLLRREYDLINESGV